MLRTHRAAHRGCPKHPKDTEAPGTANPPGDQYEHLSPPGHSDCWQFSSAIISEPRQVQTLQTGLTPVLCGAYNLGSQSEGTMTRVKEHVCPKNLMVLLAGAVRGHLLHDLCSMLGPILHWHVAQDTEFCLFCLSPRTARCLSARTRLCAPSLLVARCLAPSKKVVVVHRILKNIQKDANSCPQRVQHRKRKWKQRRQQRCPTSSMDF